MAPSMMSTLSTLPLTAAEHLVPSLIVARDAEIDLSGATMLDPEIWLLCKKRAAFIGQFQYYGFTIAVISILVAMFLTTVLQQLVPKAVRKAKPGNGVHELQPIARQRGGGVGDAEWQEVRPQLQPPPVDLPQEAHHPYLQGQVDRRGSLDSQGHNSAEEVRDVGPPAYSSQESIQTIYAHAPQAPVAAHLPEDRAPSPQLRVRDGPPLGRPAAIYGARRRLPQPALQPAPLMTAKPRTCLVVGSILLILMILLLAISALGIQCFIFCRPNGNLQLVWQIMLWITYFIACVFCSLGLGCWLILVVNLMPVHYRHAFPIQERSVITASTRLLYLPFRFLWALVYGFILMVTEVGCWIYAFSKYAWKKSPRLCF